jgi:MFS family permease
VIGMSDSDVALIRTQRRRAAIAATIGTSIEWYDFFLYNTAAALIFPKLFFPSSNPFAGQLAAFGVQFVGFAARPIGAALFGHFGDRIGRRGTLIGTLLTMGVATALIGCLPTNASIGVTAAMLLTILRIAQGIGVGGEWGGSVLLAMEWGDQRKRGLMASMPQLGVPIGLLLSTGVVRLVSDWSGAGFLVWAWRIPFLLSVALIGIGLYVRLRVLESPQFEAVVRQDAVVRQPVWRAIVEHPREILSSAFVRMAEQAPFYLFTVFVLTYGTKQLKLSQDDLLGYTMIAAAAGVVCVPLFGWLSDRIGRKVMYGIGIVCVGLYAFPYFGLLDTKAAGLVALGIVISLVLHAMQYGPQAALIAESFGANVRYSGAGIGYQLASVIAGGPAPLIATAILAATASSTWISVYIMGCAVLALLALVALPQRVPAEEPAPA